MTGLDGVLAKAEGKTSALGQIIFVDTCEHFRGKWLRLFLALDIILDFCDVVHVVVVASGQRGAQEEGGSKTKDRLCSSWCLVLPTPLLAAVLAQTQKQLTPRIPHTGEVS